MIIDNIFSIKTYLGSQPLPLFNAPTELANNNTYTGFLSNIITIYGTQTNNGVIPFFYKTNNIADPRSSLRSLDPYGSYYFISRSNSIFPYNIPFVGQLIPNAYINCPSVDVIPQKVTLTSSSGNYYYFSQDITNLNIGFPYTYNIRTLNSNWKITTTPSSGTILSSRNTNNIMSVIRFDNDANISDYTTFLPQGTEIGQVDRKNLFAILEVSLTSPQNIDCPTVIDLITIQCDSCIPPPSPTPTPTTTTTPTPTPTSTPTPTPPPQFTNSLTIVTNSTPIAGNGITFNALSGDILRYTAISPIVNSLPNTMNIRISNTQVASVTFATDYQGRAFRFTKESTGLSYNGTFQSGNVNF